MICCKDFATILILLTTGMNQQRRSEECYLLKRTQVKEKKFIISSFLAHVINFHFLLSTYLCI